MTFTAVHLDAVEGVPWPGGITWHPLRMELGLRAFGAAFYTGGPGNTVIEPHTETIDGRSHEELYVVFRGHATFTIDDRTLEAPAGTLVRVAPEAFRTAVAQAPDTLVLAFGREPTFAVSGMEWTMRAKPLMHEHPEQARAVLEAGLAELPESAAIPYGIALLEATQGRTDEARAALQLALTREPRLKDEVAGEPLLKNL